MDVSLRPSRIETGCADENGFLMYANGKLTGVLVRLEDDCHRELHARWFLEAGFGWLAGQSGVHFDSPGEARRWLAECLSPRLGAADLPSVAGDQEKPG